MSDGKDDKGDEEKVYGGCEGPDAMYVKLVSSDGHEFIVKREHALTSGTIKAMLSGPGKPSFPYDWSLVRTELLYKLNCHFIKPTCAYGTVGSYALLSVCPSLDDNNSYLRRYYRYESETLPVRKVL